MNDSRASGPCDFVEVIPCLQALLSASRPRLRLGKILVPIAFTERSLASLPYAEFLIREFGCTVTLLHVVHLNVVGEERGIPLTRFVDEMKLAAERTLHALRGSWPADCGRVVVRSGDPVRSILDEAVSADIDLIILAARRRKGLQRLFGPSVSKQVMERAPCPTLLAR